MKKRFILFNIYTTSLLILLGLVSFSFAQNIGDKVQEYGFEEGVNAENVPIGCSLDDYNDPNNAEFVLDQTVFRSGAASGLLQATDGNAVSLDSYLPNISTAKSGEKYSFSIWIKTEMTAGVIAIQDYSFALYEEHEVTISDWTEYTGEFTAAEDGNTGISIGFYGAGKIWLDDCTVTLVEKLYEIGDTLLTTSFEEGADAEGVPLIVTEITDWNGNNSVVELSTDAHSGNNSMVTYNPDAGLISQVSTDISVPGHEQYGEYRLTVWMKTEDISEGDAQVITQWDNVRYFKVAGTTGWTEYTLDYVAPSNGELRIRLHTQNIKGKAYYDDLTIVKLKDGATVPTDAVANPSFELPNDDGDAPIHWLVEGWGSGSTEIGFPGNDTARYIWDNTVSHTGEYSGKIQVTQADVDGGTMDAGWRTQTLEFLSGGIYELSYWAKTANFADGNRFRISIGYNNVDLTQITENTDWIQIQDTILFPTDQDNNGWRNQMRFRLGGPAIQDTMAEAWVDDVEFTLLGTQALQLDSITVIRNADNSVDLVWPASSDVSGATYHILMQPISADGTFEKNVLTNPGFETPNSDGSAPQDWAFWDFANGSAAAAVGEWPASETYEFGGNFSAYLGEMTPNDGAGIKARWWQTFDRAKLSRSQAYLYGAMVKYTDVVPNQDPIQSDIHPDGEYYNSGVSIFYDRSEFDFQNQSLVELGFSTPIGSSDGWEMVSFPLVYDQAQTRHRFGVGVGQLAASFGNIFLDNAFVTPFDVKGSTTETTFKIENVPADVKYFAVYVEDGSGNLIASPARIGAAKAEPVAVEDQQIPFEFSLAQNYPNPFNPSTTINFGLKVDSDVSLKIYNVLGQEIATLINKNLKAGFNRVQFNSTNLSSGVYFYRMEATGKNGVKFVDVKKMMYLK
jgi:hypothetical protein